LEDEGEDEGEGEDEDEVEGEDEDEDEHSRGGSGEGKVATEVACGSHGAVASAVPGKGGSTAVGSVVESSLKRMTATWWRSSVVHQRLNVATMPQTGDA
jgi:hypothetical protein